MLSFAGSLRVLVAIEPCDMRKSFNKLHALASEALGEDPRSGALFVFTNRRRNRLKILYFDGTGLWVLSKRLEEGAFAWPKSVENGARKLILRPEALVRQPPDRPTGSSCAERGCGHGMSGRIISYIGE